jgi:hypothetical protein
MKLTRGRWLVPALFGVFGLACGSSSDSEPGSSDSFQTVTPNGTDMPGSLIVQPPTGLPGSDVINLLVDNKPATVGTTIANLPVGAHTVATYGGALVDTITIQSNQTTTYTLAAVRIALPKEPTFGIGAFDVNGVMLVRRNGGSLRIQESDGGIFVVPQGAIHSEWGYHDGTPEITLGSGQVADVDFGNLAGRRTVRLTAPTRALPRGTPTNTVKLDEWYLSASASRAFANRDWTSLRIPDGATILVGFNAAISNLASPDTQLHIQGTAPDLEQFGTPLPFSMNPGDSPVAQNIARLDVTDVNVTNGAGGTTPVRGSYSIFANADASPLYSAPTQTGHDVFPGTYVLKTTYSTAEAGQKVTTQNVTLN